MKAAVLFTVFSILLGIGLGGCGYRAKPAAEAEPEKSELERFLIQESELRLTYHHAAAERRLSFRNFQGDFESWRREALQKFAEITGYQAPGKRRISELRTLKLDGITYHALIMEVSEDLTMPGYLLEPVGTSKGAVMAIHGHGSVEPMVGLVDDYHHQFAYELAKAGYTVLAPELRGFSTLGDLARQEEIDRLDYWNTHGQFTLVTDGFLYGDSLIGETTEDLIAWEDWFFDQFDFQEIDVAGISYGGDLALFYPVFSKRVRRIFSSGSLGSFSLIFSRCYNAPAHCIPHILNWMDRSDVAGLNAPRPILLHYGELDTPSETNHSASYNESVEPSLNELKHIYGQMQAEDRINLHVTPGSHHEMDIETLLDFLK
jgi:dienelactone hydrolase